MFKIVQIEPMPLWHITGDQEKVAMGFLRMQEHYESPRFQGEIFGLEEYKYWYAAKHGEFTYAKDFRGFNVPSNAVRAAMEYFLDHSEEELEIFDLLERTGALKEPKFYLIGSPTGLKKTLRHEICHALYYFDDAYRTTAERVIARYDLGPLKESLRSKEYAEIVINDEIQAYAVAGWWSGAPDTREMRLFRRELKSALRPLLPFPI